MLQATVMTIYMVIGVKCYMRVQATFTKTKFLLILMSFVILFLVLYQLFLKKVYTVDGTRQLVLVYDFLDCNRIYADA